MPKARVQAVVLHEPHQAAAHRCISPITVKKLRSAPTVSSRSVKGVRILGSPPFDQVLVGLLRARHTACRGDLPPGGKDRQEQGVGGEDRLCLPPVDLDPENCPRVGQLLLEEGLGAPVLGGLFEFLPGVRGQRCTGGVQRLSAGCSPRRAARDAAASRAPSVLQPVRQTAQTSAVRRSRAVCPASAERSGYASGHGPLLGQEPVRQATMDRPGKGGSRHGCDLFFARSEAPGADRLFRRLWGVGAVGEGTWCVGRGSVAMGLARLRLLWFRRGAGGAARPGSREAAVFAEEAGDVTEFDVVFL